MRPSHHGQLSTRSGPRRRALAVVATLTVFGGLVGVTQTSNAATATPSPGTGSASPGSPSPTPPGNGLKPFGNNCDNSKLAAHTGFQEGDRCVSTAFGEVGAADQNPTLLIAEAPRTVREGERFRIVVSTRNLVRDRFLPAGQGGYYLETSLLNREGLVRGHFHTSCRMLTSTSTAADPAPVPAFFVATEDGKGGKEPDLVTVEVPGLPAGLAQCSSWAGDGSHRIPMMARANQIPALDSVRIWVRAAEPPADDPGDDTPPTGQPGDDTPPGDDPGDNTPPADQPGDDTPPGDQPDNTPPPSQPGTTPPASQQPDNGQQPDKGQQPDEGQDGQQPGNGQQPGSQKPKPEKSAGDDQPSPEATDEPTPDATDVVAAPQPVRQTNVGGSGGGLALTGTNTIAFMVGGVLLLIVGVALLYLTRRRRTVRR